MNFLKPLLAICTGSMLIACAGPGSFVPVDDRTSAPVETSQPINSDSSDESTVSLDTSSLPNEKTDEAQAISLQQSESLSNENTDAALTADPEPIVIAMLNKAENHMAAGEFEQAMASLERAARIKPKDPWLWHSMAVLRLKNTQWHEAINLAQKSISLSGHNEELQAGNWQIILDAKRALGDKAGVVEAQRALARLKTVLQS